MSDRLGRMQREYAELRTRMESMNDFIYGSEIFDGLHKAEQVRMVQQLGFMESYADTLNARIWALFEG